MISSSKDKFIDILYTVLIHCGHYTDIACCSITGKDVTVYRLWLHFAFDRHMIYLFLTCLFLHFVYSCNIKNKFFIRCITLLISEFASLTFIRLFHPIHQYIRHVLSFVSLIKKYIILRKKFILY